MLKTKQESNKSLPITKTRMKRQASVGKKDQVQNVHKCLQNIQLTIGDDNLSYNTIVDAFKDHTIGKSARGLILNPLHKLYPRIIIRLIPTSNRFTQQEVLDQWQQINRLFKETLEEEFGPLIGNSSDGDSRRCKLMVQLMTKDETESFRPIPEKFGFTFTFTLTLVSSN